MTANDILIDKLLKFAPESKSFQTKIDGFSIARRNIPNMIEQCMTPSIVVVTVQGKKCSVIGNVNYYYEAGNTMIIGMNLPSSSTVIDATEKKPYCSMVLKLDASLINQISAELTNDKIDKQNMSAVACSKTEPAVLELFTRLVDLLETPEHIRYIAPLIIREIHYRLLISPLGKHIRTINFFGTQSNQIAQAITWLEKNYNVPLVIEKLARYVNMSPSTFHRNFKLVTSLSPLQFQKRIRLLEAQRLMITEGVDTLTASYKVGYESPTQFNREYKRMFGNPPAKDIKYILARAG